MEKAPKKQEPPKKPEPQAQKAEGQGSGQKQEVKVEQVETSPTGKPASRGEAQKLAEARRNEVKELKIALAKLEQVDDKGEYSEWARKLKGVKIDDYETLKTIVRIAEEEPKTNQRLASAGESFAKDLVDAVQDVGADPAEAATAIVVVSRLYVEDEGALSRLSQKVEQVFDQGKVSPDERKQIGLNISEQLARADQVAEKTVSVETLIPQGATEKVVREVVAQATKAEPENLQAHYEAVKSGEIEPQAQVLPTEQVRIPVEPHVVVEPEVSESTVQFEQPAAEPLVDANTLREFENDLRKQTEIVAQREPLIENEAHQLNEAVRTGDEQKLAQTSETIDAYHRQNPDTLVDDTIKMYSSALKRHSPEVVEVVDQYAKELARPEPDQKAVGELYQELQEKVEGKGGKRLVAGMLDLSKVEVLEDLEMAAAPRKKKFEDILRDPVPNPDPKKQEENDRLQFAKLKLLDEITSTAESAPENLKKSKFWKDEADTFQHNTGLDKRRTKYGEEIVPAVSSPQRGEILTELRERERRARMIEENELTRDDLNKKKEQNRKNLQSEQRELKKQVYNTEDAPDPTRTDRTIKSSVAKPKQLERAMSVPMSESTFDKYIKPLVTAEQVGANYADVYIDTAKTIAEQAVQKNHNAQESLDIVAHLSTLTTVGKPSQLRAEYRKILEEILLYTTTSQDARDGMVVKAEKMLIYSESEGKISPKARGKAVELLREAALNVQEKTQLFKTEGLMDIDILASPHTKRAAFELNNRMLDDRTILEKTVELDRIRGEINKNTLLSSDDKNKLIQFIMSKEVVAFEATLGLPAHIVTEGKNIEEQRKQISETRDVFKVQELEQPIQITDQNGNVTTFIPDSDPEIRALYGKLVDVLNPKHDELGVFTGDVEQYLLKVVAGLKIQNIPELDQIAGRLETIGKQVLDVARKKDQWLMKVNELGIEPQLANVGIRSAKLQECYEMALNPSTFIAKYNAAPDKTVFIDDFIANAKQFKDEMLKVAESDHERFFNDLFTNFYHDHIYNNFVAGLKSIQLTVRKMEETPVPNPNHDPALRDRMLIELKVEKTVFNPETKAYENQGKIKLSERFEQFRDYVSMEREITRYFHDAYALSLHRSPLESYSKYAESLNPTRIQILFDENPDLEVAVRHHMHYLRVRQGYENSWKSPDASMYLLDPATRMIPIDEYVIHQLERHKVVVPNEKTGELEEKPLEPWQRERLAALARGFLLFGDLSALGTMASGGPGKAGAEAYTQNWFGPLNEINRMRFNEGRWETNIFGKFEMWLVAPAGEDADSTFSIGKAILGPFGRAAWSPKEHAYKAEQIKKLRRTKEPPRVVTEKMVKEGIPVIEDDSMGGGFSLPERAGWREIIYKHLSTDINADDLKGSEPKNKESRAKKIRQLMNVSLYHANDVVESMHADKTVNRDERNQLRSEILYRLQGIAPQEFLILENELAKHSVLQSYSEDKKRELMMKTGVVTDYLLSCTVGDRAPTIQDLNDNDVEWEYLFPDSGERTEIREFVNRLQQVSEAAIEGTSGIVLPGESQPMVPWKEAVRFRSFPTHLEVKRNARWAKLQQGGTARAIGDRDRIHKGWDKFINGTRATISDYNVHPDKARDEKFDTYHKLVNEMVMVYDGVYGLTSKDRSKASSFALGYKLEFIGLKTFQKAWSSRLPAGIGSVTSVTDPFSSWSHYSTGRHDVLQLDEQNARVWVDGAEKRGNVAPSHGLIVDKDDIQKGMKILGVKMPFGYHAKLTKIHWNGGQLRADAGARNIQVLYDISRSAIPLLFFLIGLSALQSWQKEESK